MKTLARVFTLEKKEPRHVQRPFIQRFAKFVRMYELGFSQKEISQDLQLRPATYKKYLALARKEMTSEFNPELIKYKVIAALRELDTVTQRLERLYFKETAKKKPEFIKLRMILQDKARTAKGKIHTLQTAGYIPKDPIILQQFTQNLKVVENKQTIFNIMKEVRSMVKEEKAKELEEEEEDELEVEVKNG